MRTLKSLVLIFISLFLLTCVEVDTATDDGKGADDQKGGDKTTTDIGEGVDESQINIDSNVTNDNENNSTIISEDNTRTRTTTINIEGDVEDSQINVDSTVTNENKDDSKTTNVTISTDSDPLTVPVTVQGEDKSAEFDHEYVLKMIDYGYAPEIELDSDENAIIAYKGIDGSIKLGKVISEVTDSAINVDITIKNKDDTGKAGTPSLVVDSNNKWGIAYTQNDGIEIKYISADKFEDSAKIYTVINNLTPYYLRTDVIVRVDNNNVPVILYGHGSNDLYLYFASLNNEKFDIYDTNIEFDGSWYTSIDFIFNSENNKSLILDNNGPDFYLENALGEFQKIFSKNSNWSYTRQIVYSNDEYCFLRYGQYSVHLYCYDIINNDYTIEDEMIRYSDSDWSYYGYLRGPALLQFYDSKMIVVGTGSYNSYSTDQIGLNITTRKSPENWSFVMFNEINTSTINALDFVITNDGKVKIVFEIARKDLKNKIGYIEYKL